MTDLDWWYVRVYPGRSELLDEATRVVVPWLARSAATAGGTDWFFMRYLDMTGQHLRLRLRAGPDAVDDLHTRLPELQELVRGISGPGATARLVPGAEMMNRPGPPRVRAGFYSPELFKYGGPAGVRVAERLFTASSRWYLDAGIASLDPCTERAALGVRLLRHAVTAALPGRESEFWAAHRRQWGLRLRSVVPGQAEFRELTRGAAAAITGTATPAVPGLDDHVATLVAALDEARAADVAVPRAALLLHYLHMEMNRWGFLPAEECLLGLVAAAMPARSSSS